MHSRCGKPSLTSKESLPLTFLFNSISNGSRKAPPFFFQDTFECLMKLPTIDLHLTHPEFTLPYFSHLSQFRNISKFSLTGYQNSSTRTIEKTLARVLANNHRLSYVFLCLVDRWDRRTTRVVISGIERVSPRMPLSPFVICH